MTNCSNELTALRELFAQPPRDFSPAPLWWWSGARVTRERMRWQMERFAAGGVFNLVIINLAPAGPIVGGRGDDPAWFSEEWWARFTDACEIAQELGMRIWFYDQLGFSGANVQGAITNRHPEAAGRAIRSHVLDVQNGRVLLAGVEEPIVAYSESGVRIHIDATGTVQAADGDRVRLVASVPTAFDYLDKHAVGLLLETIHHEYDRRVPHFLGTVIAGSFQDELPATNSWTPRFAEEFAARKGYDLLDHMPALWQTGDEHAAKVRGDYYAVRTELTEEALFRPLGQWHTERGLLIGSDQSNPARAGNPTQATQIYTDYFRTHRWYGAAGSDHEGDAKVHSSMAHLYGHERVWIESFHSSGWGGTLEDTYDWLLPFLRSGANLYNPHASYFGTAGGWFEWAPPSTDWRQPYWRQYPAFARAVSRIASILSWGTYSADVALLHPTATAQALLTLDSPIDHFGDGQLGGDSVDVDTTQRDYLALAGANNWFATKPGALDTAGIAFDVIDDDSIQRSDAQNGCIAVREQRYSTVILPSAIVLEERTARRLLDLLDQGGRVIIVGQAPRFAAGTAGDDAVVRSLTADSRVIQVSDAAAAVAKIPAPTGYATSDVPLLVRRSGDLAVSLVTGAFPNASAYPLRTDTWLWKDYDFDSSRYASTRTVDVSVPVAEAWVWNPATGAQSAATVSVEDGVSHIAVALDGAPAVLVVWREGEPQASAVPATHAETISIDASTGWTGALVPTMDNSWGDLALPAGADVAELQIWSMDWAETNESEFRPEAWERTKVTFGQRVRVHPPVEAADAPDPLSPQQASDVVAGRLPLADANWLTKVYSTSRGIEKPRNNALGAKAIVPEEFVEVLAPADGQLALLRAIVSTDRLGEADLVVAAGAAKRVWWNGLELPVTAGYSSIMRVQVERPLNVLEYRLGVTENHAGMSVFDGPHILGSFYTLVRPNGFGTRPEFMTVGNGVVPDGRVTYNATVEVPSPATSARLIVGAATGLTVLIDGEVVARQEKVEYYESSWGAKPMYFGHDVTARVTAGRHTLEIIADSTDARDVVFADLVIEHLAGVLTLVSGAGWTAASGGATSLSLEHRGHWNELVSAHAATRTHPLPETSWLHGEQIVGKTVDNVRSTDNARPTVQWFRILLPAGTVVVTMPLLVAASATMAGLPATITGNTITLVAPLTEPTEFVVRTEAVVTERAGASWSGPLRVQTVRAPIELGSWRELGLLSWSGCVSYRRTLQVPAGASDVTLDLGRVRGSVEVTVNGTPIGEAFCAPFRFALGEVSGAVELEVTVYNTLAPFFDESTPTTWVFPSQLESGLVGPVTLHASAVDAG